MRMTWARAFNSRRAVFEAYQIRIQGWVEVRKSEWNRPRNFLGSELAYRHIKVHGNKYLNELNQAELAFARKDYRVDLASLKGIAEDVFGANQM